jgi:hypothetical protein
MAENIDVKGLFRENKVKISAYLGRMRKLLGDIK